MFEKRAPHYSLALVRTLVRAGSVTITARVYAYLRARGWEVEYVERCLECLAQADLHKSQAHRDRPGEWLDIYRPTFEGQRLYVKFTVESRIVRVLSFCIDGDEH